MREIKKLVKELCAANVTSEWGRAHRAVVGKKMVRSFYMKTGSGAQGPWTSLCVCVGCRDE